VYNEVPVPVEVKVQHIVDRVEIREVPTERVVMQEVPVMVDKVIVRDVPYPVERFVEKDVIKEVQKVVVNEQPVYGRLPVAACARLRRGARVQTRCERWSREPRAASREPRPDVLNLGARLTTRLCSGSDCSAGGERAGGAHRGAGGRGRGRKGGRTGGCKVCGAVH
jgi:hypothetical protein